VRHAGIRAINLLEGERLVTRARVTDGEQRRGAWPASAGLAIRFHETDCPPHGPHRPRRARASPWPTASEAVGMVVVGSGEDRAASLLSLTANGYGKRTPLSRLPRPAAGRQGPDHHQVQPAQRPAHGRARTWSSGEQLMVITRGGIMIRIALDDVSMQGRNTQGVRIINLKGEDMVGGFAKIGQEALAEDPEDPEALVDSEATEGAPGGTGEAPADEPKAPEGEEGPETE
jgi:DNA gyrase subunit A